MANVKKTIFFALMVMIVAHQMSGMVFDKDGKQILMPGFREKSIFLNQDNQLVLSKKCRDTSIVDREVTKNIHQDGRITWHTTKKYAVKKDTVNVEHLLDKDGNLILHEWFKQKNIKTTDLCVLSGESRYETLNKEILAWGNPVSVSLFRLDLRLSEDKIGDERQDEKKIFISNLDYPEDEDVLWHNNAKCDDIRSCYLTVDFENKKGNPPFDGCDFPIDLKKFKKTVKPIGKAKKSLHMWNALENRQYDSNCSELYNAKALYTNKFNSLWPWQKLLNLFTYRRTCATIDQEIQSFENQKNRIAFTRSCVKTPIAYLIQDARRRYLEE